MSKKRPNKVFEITTDSGNSVIVLARHKKGAFSLAAQELPDLDLNELTHLERMRMLKELPEHMKTKAVNWKTS